MRGITVRRLLGYLKPHTRSLLLAFLLLLAATAADLAGPVLLKIFIDDYLTPRVFDREALIKLAGIYLLLLLAAVGFEYWQLLNFHKIALRIIRELRMDLFAGVQRLGVAYFDRNPTGVLVSRVTNDTEAVKDLFDSVLSTFVQNIVFVAGIFVAMLILNPKLAGFCLLLLPVILALMHAYRRLSSGVYRIMRSSLGMINAGLNESLQGMGVIQAMRQELRLAGEFDRVSRGYYRAALKNIRLNALMLRPAVDLIYMLALVTVLGYFGVNSLSSYVQIGVLYAFINYIDRLFEPVNMMMMKLSQFQQAIAAAERIFEIFDEKNLALSTPAGCGEAITRGWVCFEDVSFSYDGSTEVLKNISFRVEPGQTVALVGHTGSGKSTIVNLLMRFYPVRRGGITIDGTPLEDIPDRELRQKMGLVLQEPFLFAGDIEQNIRLGGTSMAKEEIIKAAKFVQADSFIRELPAQYGEPVAEGGATLSVGQRQLLSFARAMAANPKILILDEATASIDTETEELIQGALEKMRKGRTTIAIAHRLSTIQDADLILVLHRGQIVERGTHRELLARQGLYHKMFLLQQGGSDL